MPDFEDKDRAMTDARTAVEAYADEIATGVVVDRFGDPWAPREDVAPAAFAALRAVLDLCDKRDALFRVAYGENSPYAEATRAAIVKALEGQSDDSGRA